MSRASSFIGVLALLLASCGPAAPTVPASGGPPREAAEPPARPSKTLVMIGSVEPDSLAGTSMAPRSGSTASRRRPFNAGLVLMDADNRPLPYLAEALPQLNTDSWRVLPDGRMETTYRLRPNLGWHDGSPLTADDFAFALEVYSTPQFGQSGTEPINMMQEVVAPDPRTVLIRWRGAYAEAGVLESVVSTGVPTGGPSFSPLPRHILGRVYQEQRETFLTHPYWTVDFVGAGPYRLDRWESGAFVEAVAFDRHALGRPKIDRIKLIWNGDSSAVLANLLSAEAHLPIDGAIGIAEGQILQREWAAQNVGTVRFDPKNWRYMAFQHRPDHANPRAILDSRVRKALAHTVDRQGLNEAVYHGVGLLTDSMFYPSFAYSAQLERSVPKYQLDPLRADALIQEAGYRKGADGTYQVPGEGRLGLQLKGAASAVGAAERTVVAAGWRQAGFDVEEVVLSPAETRDGQTVATFRSMYQSAAPAGTQALGLFTTATIPRPENRWVGGNRGGWSNPEYDRLTGAVQSTLEPGERAQNIIQAAQLLTEQVGVASLLFVPWVVVFPGAVQGMSLRAPDGDQTWNIYQWELR